jgi:hypothetical protein
MKTRLKPVYFENQKQCAAALGLDEYELKEWKAENCSAFRYGRIYHAELLEWLENHKHARRKPPVAQTFSLEPAKTGNERMDRVLDVCQTIVALTNCANRELITDGRYLEIGTEIMRSITDEIKEWPEGKSIVTDWAEKLLKYLGRSCRGFSSTSVVVSAHGSRPPVLPCRFRRERGWPSIQIKVRMNTAR